MLIVGGIIAGFSVGIAAAIIPLYQAEITALHLRDFHTRIIEASFTIVTISTLTIKFVSFDFLL
jgi:hypothetical protein